MCNANNRHGTSTCYIHPVKRCKLCLMNIFFGTFMRLKKYFDKSLGKLNWLWCKNN